jgi:hypothetical protein
MDIIVAIGSPGTEAPHSQHLRATKYRFVPVNTAIDHVSLIILFRIAAKKRVEKTLRRV